MKTKLWYLITVIVILSMTAGIAMADDSITFRRNISKTPEQESEKAGLAFMKFTVPAQASDGTLLEGIDYIADDLSVTYTTTTAKPLLAVYIDDLPHDPLAPVTIKSGLSIGRHDTYIAHSLDDGSTWKSTNVSRAADLSSF